MRILCKKDQNFKEFRSAVVKAMAIEVDERNDEGSNNYANDVYVKQEPL